MGTIADQIAAAFRDYVTDGVPASGTHEPIKSEIRAVGPAIEAALSTIGFGALVDVVYATRAGLFADLAHDANSVGLVYADSTDSYNDLYVKSGASGAGAWTNTGALHAIVEGLAQPYVDLASGFADAAAASSIANNVRIRNAPTNDAANLFPAAPTVNLISGTIGTFSNGVFTVPTSGWSQVYASGLSLDSGSKFAAAFSLLGGAPNYVALVIKSGGISGATVQTLTATIVGGRYVFSTTLPAAADTVSFLIRSDASGPSTASTFGIFPGVLDEPLTAKTPVAVQASIDTTIDPVKLSARFLNRARAISYGYARPRPAPPRTIEMSRAMARQERLRIRASENLTGPGKTMWLSATGTGNGLSVGAPGNIATVEAALEAGDTLNVVGNFGGGLVLTVPPIKINGLQADGVTKARIDGRVFPGAAVQDMGGGIYRFPVASRPGGICYDLKQDDLAGTVTGLAVNSPWFMAELARCGASQDRALAWYGWFLPHSSTTDTTTPAAELWAYSGGYAYVNIPGITLAAAQNTTTGIAYCPQVAAILTIQKKAGYDFLHGLHVSDFELYHNPSIRDAVTYALSTSASSGLFENLDCAQNGYHSVTLAAGNDVRNTMYRCHTFGMTADTLRLNGNVAAGRGAGLALPYVFYRDVSSDPFKADAEHYGKALFFMAYPLLSRAGAPVEPTAAHYARLGYSHTPGSGATLGGLTWEGCTMFDMSADLDAKHGSTLSKANVAGMLGPMSAANTPALIDVDPESDAFGPHFHAKNIDCHFYGPSASWPLFMANYGTRVIRYRQQLVSGNWTATPVGFSTDLLQNNNVYSGDAFVPVHGDGGVFLPGNARIFFGTLNDKTRTRWGGGMVVDITNLVDGTSTVPVPLIAPLSSPTTTGKMVLDGINLVGNMTANQALFSISGALPATIPPSIVSKGNNIFDDGLTAFAVRQGTGANLERWYAANWLSKGAPYDLVNYDGALPQGVQT